MTPGPGDDRPSPMHAARADARARFDALARRSAPVFSPRALAAAIALGTLTAFTTGLQFATPVLDHAPGLAYALAFGIAGLAGALAALIAIRGAWERGPIVAFTAAIAVGTIAVGCAGARHQWERGLDGNPYYTLAARATRFPKDATTVDFLASDGVPLRGTMLGGRRPFGVVIVPSWRSNRDGFAIATLATWLANDLDVLVIDPRGQGESGGAKSPDGAERLDVLAAIQQLRATGHARVGVLAEQDACIPALLAIQERREAFDALALVGPSPRWGDSLGGAWDPRGFPGRMYWRIAGGLRLAGGGPGPGLPALQAAIKKAAPVPLLIAGPRSEAGATIDSLHQAAGEPKSLIVIGGEGRPIAWSHFAAYYQAVSDWLALALDPPAPGGGQPAG